MGLNNKTNLKSQASTIRHEYQDGLNTAERVGKVLEEIIENADASLTTETNSRTSAINSTNQQLSIVSNTATTAYNEAKDAKSRATNAQAAAAAEATARQQADAALGQRIDVEREKSVERDDLLAEKVDNLEIETTRTTRGLNDEIARALNAERNLTKAISDERVRATTSEQLIRDNLDVVDGDLRSLLAKAGLPGGMVLLSSNGTIAARFIPGAMDDVKAFSGCVNSSIFEENGVRFYDGTEDTSAASNSYVVYDTHLQMFLLKQYAGGGTYDFYRTWGDAELWNDLDAGSPHDDKVYVDRTTNKTYRWAEDYGLVVIGTDLALGETAYTAYPGNLGAQLARDLSDEEASRTDADGLLQEQITGHRREFHYLPDNYDTENALFAAAGTYVISTKPIKPGALLLGCVDECWGVYQYTYLPQPDESEASAQSDDAAQATPAAAPPAVKHDANIANPENWVRLATLADVEILRSEVAGLANTTKDFNDDFSEDFSN
jgi:hypothetical protein